MLKITGRFVGKVREGDLVSKRIGLIFSTVRLYKVVKVNKKSVVLKADDEETFRVMTDEKATSNIYRRLINEEDFV